MPGGPRPPLDVVLSWPQSNSVDPETRGSGILVLEGILLSMCFIVVGLRLYARLGQDHNFGLDDGAIVLSLFPLTGMAACIVLGYARFGYDRHVWDVSSQQIKAGRMNILAYTTVYTVATGMTKLSVLLFYRRLAVGTLSRAFRCLLYTAQASVVAYMVVFLVLMWTSCRPINAFWNQVETYWRTGDSSKFRCFDEGAIITSGSIISMLQDFIACALPMVLFWKLQIPTRKKFALMVIFSFGYILCICAILRARYTMVLYHETYDVTWAGHPIWITTILESHLGILCASIPALHYFFRKALSGSSIASRLRTVFHSPRTAEDEERTTLQTRNVAMDCSGDHQQSHAEVQSSPELELQKINLEAGRWSSASYTVSGEARLEDNSLKKDARHSSGQVDPVV